MPETIGQRLKKAREYRNLTLEKVADATHIRVQFLQALEADDFSAIPSPVQARGFLRNYAQYLELDLDQMVADLRAEPLDVEVEPDVIFEGEQTQPLPVEKQPELETGEEVSPEPFWKTWLRRTRQESGILDEDPESQPPPEPALAIQTESTSETGLVSEDGATQGDRNEASDKAGDEIRNKLWESLLNKANIRFSQKSVEEPPLPVEEEPTPELEPEPEIETPAEPIPSSQEIINKIGLQLRQRRELISLTLEEIERHTRMRAQFLESLEKGNFDDLPSPVQTRGMLTNYATFLDLDVEDFLLQFAEALQARHRERHPESLTRKRKRVNVPSSVPTLRSFIASDMIFGVGVVLLLVIFSIWGISRVVAVQTEQQQSEVQAEATGLSISEALIGTPVETVEAEVPLISSEDTPIPNLPEGTLEIPTPAFNINVQINIVAIERAFLRVIVDEEVVFDGRTIPGNAYPFEAEQSIEVLTGNGAALRVLYNQRDQGLLGGFGQIVSYIYTADEIIEPTPVIPPTPTNTPFLSPTPSITPSPTLTALPEEGLE